MSIQDNIAELRAELHNRTDWEERKIIQNHLDLAIQYAVAIQFKEWRLAYLVEAQTNNAPDLAQCETDYMITCKEAAEAQIAYDMARGA